MSISISAPASARQPTSVLKKHLITGCLLLLSCLGIEPVLAAGECSLSPISAQTQYGQGGATLVYSFTLTDNGGCNAESGLVKIVSDTTESATVNKTVWSTGVNKPTSITVKLGGNIGGQVEVVVACKNCAAPTSLTFTGVVTGDYLFVAKPLSSINSTVAADDLLPLVVSLTKTGTPVPGELVVWKQISGPFTANIAPVTGKFTDSNGENRIDFKASVDGIYKVRASVCDPADTRFCTELSVDFTIDVGGTPGGLQFTRVSPGTPVSASPGDKVTLTAEYLFKSSGYIGQDVTWSISPLGGASLGTNVTPVTDSSGRVSNVVNIDSPGSYTVTATAKCDGPEPGCQPADIIWLINVGTAKLAITGGDGQTGAINTIVGGLTIEATTGGSPDSGLPINWSVVSGDATINATSGPTDTGGKAAANVLFGNTPGTVIVRAERSDNPSIRVFFTLASGIPQLDNLSGTPTVAAGQSISLIAFANLGGVAITTGRVNWTNNNPGATSIGATSTLVDLTGRASTTFTANQGGLFTVSACFSATGNTTCIGGDPTTTFTINAIALKKISGDAQSITVGNLSAALAVKLESGTVPNPLTIEWTVSGPATLTAPTTPLNGSGNSNNTVTATGPGAISVTASWVSSLRSFPTQSVIFNLTAAAPVTRTITVAPPSIEVYPGSGPYTIDFTTFNNGVRAPGVTINFSAIGGASVSPASCLSDINGVCIINVDPSGIAFPGSGAVTGTRADDTTVSATHNVTLVLPNISLTGSSTTGNPGALVTLTANVRDGTVANVPVENQAIAWTIVSGAAGSTLAATSSNTDSFGIATNSITLGPLAGPVLLRATYNYGSGNVSADFTVTVNTIRTLLIHDGDAQTTPAGLAFPVNVVVEALNNGLSAPDGTQILYSIDASTTATGAVLSCCGTTSGGFSGVGVTAGTTQGNLVIRAERVDNPAAFVLFNLTVAPPVLQSIAVTPATPTIASNGAQTFVATGTFSDASTVDISASVTWNSSNTSLATMTGATANGAGSFTGGATTITATQGAISGTATLNVTAAPVVLVSIAVTPATTTIASNGSQTYVATGTFNNTSTADLSASVTWSSSNTSLAMMTGATANGAGSFTGGATTITATQGVISGTATLNVTAAPVVLVSIAVTPATPAIAFNGSQIFVATGTYNDSSTANISASVTWASSNTSLATMTGATANGAGSFTGGATTITATQGTITGTATLNVTAAPIVLVSIAVTPATTTIASNGSQTYVATGTFNDASTANISGSVVWTSGNTSLATMTGATANGAGSFTGGATTITATQGVISGTATLNVNPAAVVLVSIAVTPATTTIASNGSQTYVATGTFNDASTADLSASVTWTSSNTTLATMTGATANGAGSFTGGATTITATQGAISGTATLNVNPAAVVLVSIAVTPATATIASNGSQTYVATGTFNDASTANISGSVVWTSGNTTLATMTGATANGAGSFTGGATTITATQGAISGTATLNVTAAPVVLVSIAVTPATPTIAFNGSQIFVATGTYNDSSTANISASVTWASSNTSLATMTGATANGAGSFTGGATTITATQGAISGTATLNVTAAPVVLVSIAVTPATTTIASNGSQTYVATGTFNNTSTADLSASVTWTSSNTSLATMTGATANGAGSFTGGATTITAAQGAISGTATLSVTAAPVVLVSIAVTPATTTIASNGSQTYVATGTFNNASTADLSASVTWTSSNTTLATMTGATANGAGSFTGGATTITATQGAISGTATLNVNPAAVVLVSIAVTPATATIASNGSQTYVATGTFNDASTANISASVTWNSSNTSLAMMTGATANGAGSFTGGATTITATQGAISGTATLNVNAAAVVLVSIAVTPATTTIASNGSQTYIATGTFNDASTANISASVVWTSSNTTLATMTSATANGAGSFIGGATTITATQGAISGTATLNVNPAAVVLVSIAVTPATTTIASNGSQTYVATGTFNDASTANISASVIWTSSNTSLATMTGATANGAGSFTGGATTITATQGAISGTATLNVNPAAVVLVSIALTPATTTIASNGSQTYVATGTFNNASTADLSASVTWTSSNTTLATMTGATANGAGSFTGGATTITATQGAISGTATLNVNPAAVVLVSIAVTPATATIASNGSQTYVATGTFNDASTANISASVVWTSGNTTLATMTGATANGAGSFTGGATTITATQGVISGTATLNVNPAAVVLVSIAVTPATTTFASNGSQTYVATGTFNNTSTADLSASVTWSSSNTSLATMTGATANGAGSLTGGATTITATQGAISGTATLNVTAATAVKTIAIISGNGQSVIAGNALTTMSVSAQDNGVPVSGLSISWTVSGTGSATPAITSSITDAGGIALINMTSVNPGLITVTAARSDDLTKFVAFNHTINAVPASTLTKQSGDNQQGVLGSLINNPLVVRLQDGFGAALSGQTISWSVLSGPATLSGTSSLTNASGDGQISLTFGNTSGAATIRASALGGSLTQNFTASAVTVTLGSASGNGQSAPVSTVLPLPLTVQITPPTGVTSIGPKSGSIKALSGVPITFAVTTGTGAVLSVTNTVTNAGGSASTTLTLGPGAGAYVVTASTPGGSTTSFTATATTLAVGDSITKLNGDSQSLTPGNASVLMRVRLLDVANNPVPGAIIQWTAVNGTLTAATSTTNAAGEATNVVTALSSGVVSVSASYTDPLSSLVTGPVTFSHNAGISNLSGLTTEQESIADAIDTLCPALAAITSPTPTQQALLNDCRAIINAAGIDPAAATNALDQLIPNIAIAQATASMLAAQSQFQNLKARIAALRSGTQGSSFEGLAFTNGSGTISLGALGNALTGDDEPSPQVGADFQRWGFFAAGTIGRGEAEAGNINPAFDYDINGLTAGVDYRYSDKFIFGAAIGITRQGTDLNGSEGTLDTTGWSASAYSTFYKENSWYADTVLTYGRNNYDLERRIRYSLPLVGGGFTTIDQTGRSSSSGDMLEAAFTFGHDFQKGGLSIGPYARLLYTKLGFDQSVETLEAGPGSGLGVVIETRDLTSIASQVGAKFTYSHSTDWGVVIPHVQVEWEHEFKDDPAQITTRFLNDPTATPIVITGDPQDTDYFRIGLGLSMILSKGRSGFFYYEQVLGRDGYSQYNLGLGLRMEF